VASVAKRLVASMETVASPLLVVSSRLSVESAETKALSLSVELAKIVESRVSVALEETVVTTLSADMEEMASETFSGVD